MKAIFNYKFTIVMAKGKGKGFSAGPGGRDGGGQAGPLRGMIVKLTKTDMQNSTKKALLQIIRQAIDIAPSLPKLAELLQATLGHKVCATCGI